MNHSLVQRLVGAIVLLVLCAVLWPFIFETPEQANRDVVSQIPDAPTLEVFEIPREKRPDLLESVEEIQESLRAPVVTSEPVLDELEQLAPATEVVSVAPQAPAIEETTVAEAENQAAVKNLEAELDDKAGSANDDKQPQDPPSELAAQAEPESEAKAEPEIKVESEAKVDTVAETVADAETSKALEAKPAQNYELPVKPVEVKPNPIGKMWALQVGVFGQAANAQKVANQYRDQGYPVVVQKRSPNTRQLHFVLIGPYMNEDDVYTDALLLEKQAIKAMVVNFRP